jgi:hypothetical protein
MMANTEKTVINFKELSRNLIGKTEENHAKYVMILDSEGDISNQAHPQ